ncbi:MAG: alpha/beta fold hydrolase [Pseudomonadota bacterium]
MIGRVLRVLLALLIIVGIAAWIWGPREPVDREIAFDAAALPDDLDAWVAESEATVPSLRAGAEKRIVWAGTPGVQTPLALVYVHGFSASAEEIRPVPDRVAEELGANLFFARLTGHGRDGPAMAEADAGAWIEDLAEAMAVGRRLGERVILIGTSTGGTLAILAAHDPLLSEGLAGLVLVSPNFAVNNPAAPLLTFPWARDFLPWLVGEERSFEPHNEGHGLHWTTRYPTEAVLPMAALVTHVRRLDHVEQEMPAMFLYSEHDKVIVPAAVREVHDRWGGPKGLHTFVMGRGDDPSSHVIAGDILSPGHTDRAVSLIVDWAHSIADASQAAE